jgi:hypothetical protein
MISTVTISCTVDTTDSSAALGFEAWINDHKFFDLDHVLERQQIFVEISDNDSEHELRFVMKNKTSDHTRVDSNGDITTDARLVIADLAFDGINLGHLVTEHSVYTHDFNGTGTMTHDKFYGELGCNGTVSLKFATPMYLWLLEHM